MFVFLFLQYTDIIELHQVDSNGDPVMNNQVVTITGKVTVADEFGLKGPFFVEDSTAGIAVYDYYGQYTGGLDIGDSVVVRGKVRPYKGLTELQYLEEVTVVSHSSEPQPETIKLNDMGKIENGYEINEGRFVIVLNLTFVDTGTFEVGKPYTVRDDEGNEGVVFIKSDAFNGVPIPDYKVYVKGVVGQYDTEAPYFEGYELLPRTPADIDSMPELGTQLKDDDYDIDVLYHDGRIRIEGVKAGTTVEVYDLIGNIVMKDRVDEKGGVDFPYRGVFFVRCRNRITRIVTW